MSKLKKSRRPRGYVKSLYWFPLDQISMTDVRKNFTIEYYEDQDQPVVLEMFTSKKRKGITWIGLPRGDKDRIKACLIKQSDWGRVADRRTRAPRDLSQLKFQGEFRKGQLKGSKAMAASTNGVLKAAPRTGKCLGENTLLLTSLGALRICRLPIGDLIKDTGTERWYEPRTPFQVAGPDGPRDVTAIYHSEAPLFRVETSSGHVIEGTEDEKLWVIGKGWTMIKDLVALDSVQVGHAPLTKPKGRLYSKLPPQYSNKSGNRLNQAIIVLLAYRGRMMINSKTSQLGSSVYARLDASAGCLNFARLLIYRLTGVAQPREGDAMLIPAWLWSMLNTLYVAGFIPDAIRVLSSDDMVTYLRALFEATAFRDRMLEPNVKFSLAWGLPSPMMLEQAQIILQNYGVYTSRTDALLTADDYNSAKFLALLKIKGIAIPDYRGMEETFPLCLIKSIRPLGTRPVFDLSVGKTEDEHNFIASGMLVHNTVIGTEAVIRANQKTLIMAHQSDLIQQFCNETINDPTQILFNGDRFRKSPAAMVSTLKEIEQHDICLMTYQTFISKKGQKLLKKVKHMFGTILIDEVHRAPATKYSQILSKFSAVHMWGLTATDDRKDGLWPVVEMMLGRVIHTVRAKALSARVYAMETGIKHRSPPKTWQGQINFLFKSEERNKLIARTALADVRRGHTVLIPVIYHEHAAAIRKEIIKQHGSKDIVFTFTGMIPKNRRDWAREMMRNDPKARIHIANRSMLTGVNVPRWSAIYTVVPITNPPLYEQEIQRVCTVEPGKPTPIIRYFYDGVLSPSPRWINVCAKTLGKAELGHRLTDSFHFFNRTAAAIKRGPAEFDEFSKTMSPSSKHRSPSSGFAGIQF